MSSVDKTTIQPQFMASFNHKIILFTLVALPLLLCLGFWQLNRAADKRQIQADYEQRQTQTPVVITSENIRNLPDYQRVFVQGSFDNDHTWLLDNKQRQGSIGYEVVSPFVLEDGNRILVNRGWAAAGNTRAELPVIAPVNNVVTIFAELASVTDHPLLDAKSEQQAWPKVVMAMELGTMEQQLGENLMPRYLRLDESSPGAFLTEWRPINVSADKHLGYAVQWFAMAIALAIWFFCANTNVIQYWHSRVGKKNQA